MSSSAVPAVDIRLSALEHMHACLHEVFLQAQPPLTAALRLLAQHVFQPLPPRTPADEIYDRLDQVMQQQFEPTGDWDIFSVFIVLRQIRPKFLDACNVVDYHERKMVERSCKTVLVVRDWFAGHGSCQYNDICGAILALKHVLLTMLCIPHCPQDLTDLLCSTSYSIQETLNRALNATAGSLQLPLSSAAFVLVSRALTGVEDAICAHDAASYPRFPQVVQALKRYAHHQKQKNPKFDAAGFEAFAAILLNVRNRVFHVTREVTASMLDAVAAASEVLYIMGNEELGAAGDMLRSKSLQAHRLALLQAFSDQYMAPSSCFGIRLSRALTESANACPFFGGALGSSANHDATATVCAAVVLHVFKGTVHVPDYQPCDCFKSQVPGKDKKRIGELLTPCVGILTAIPQFHALNLVQLKASISAPHLKNTVELCGLAIVSALPAGHKCGSFVFSNDADGHLLAVRHMVVNEKLRGVYHVECVCKCSMDKAFFSSCDATKVFSETHIVVKASGLPLCGRVSLPIIPDDFTNADSLLHVSEAASVNAILNSGSGDQLCAPVLLHDSPQAGVQPIVDQHSGIALVDRETQISDAVTLLQPLVSGAHSAGEMFAALILGPSGTGKSSCGHEVMYRLSKRKLPECCMDEITCRNATTVRAGLVSLGLRMSKTLAVGADTPAADVLKALRLHLANTP
jgi:hypothetical protein